MVERKLPSLIQQNTTNIATVDARLNTVVNQTEKFLNELYDRQEQMEGDQERARVDDPKSSFLIYKHGLSYAQLREGAPRKAIYDVVDLFFKEVLGAQPADFPVNAVVVLGADKAQQAGWEPDKVGLLVTTGRKGAWTAMVSRYALFECLEDWHARRAPTAPFYSIQENKTVKARDQDKHV